MLRESDDRIPLYAEPIPSRDCTAYDQRPVLVCSVLGAMLIFNPGAHRRSLSSPAHQGNVGCD